MARSVEPGELTIVLEFAQGLGDSAWGDWFGNQDPYCIIKCGRHTFRSRAPPAAGKNPVWNETFRCRINTETELSISLMDKCMLVDASLGTGVAQLARVRDYGTDRQQVPIMSSKGENHGIVQITLAFTNDSHQPVQMPPPNYAMPAYIAPPPQWPGAPPSGFGPPPAIGVPVPQYGPPPGYGIPPPGYSTAQPGYGGHPPQAYDAPPQGYSSTQPGNPAPFPGSAAPGYGAYPPGYGTAPSGYGMPPPGQGYPGSGGHYGYGAGPSQAAPYPSQPGSEADKSNIPQPHKPS